MDIHYNAFISYRHHPDDIRVASQIHRLLERYHVPRAIRKKGGSITRLFRDKEELPITSNLTDDITRALENSDFLIVICSPHTRESTWVRREIETFLKTHDRSRVLTVLAEGEPYDTIPEILLREEKVDLETGETVLAEMEPLSCDWRMDLRRARREELPRLAAALLDCGYDELRQRERQYRTRRLAATLSVAMAAVLCFTGYVMYNSLRIQEANDRLEQANTQLENANVSLENANAEIQANLNEALINQSQYLASSAEKLWEEGDRFTALLLALEALPEYESQRPYVPEAEYALAYVLGAYNAEESLVAAGSFTCDALVGDFCVTEDGNTIYIRDARNVLTVWDTQTFEKLATVTLPHDANKMLPTAAGDLIVLGMYDALSCYDREGRQVWAFDGDPTDVAFLGDRETVMVNSWEEIGWDTYIDLHILDARTGEPVRNALQTPLESFDFQQEVYPAANKLVVSNYHYPGWDLYALDPETGEAELLGEGYYYVYRCGMTNDGNLLALVQKEALSGMQGSFVGMTITTPEVLQLQCYAADSGELLWETELTTYVYSGCDTLEIIPGSTDILCQTGTDFLVVDSGTGAVKARGQSAGSVLWTHVMESYTRILLEDGSIGVFYHDDGRCGFMDGTKGDLIGVDVSSDGYYVVDNLSTQVTAYRFLGDPNRTPLEGSYVYSDVWLSWGDYLALESYSKLQMLDTGTETLLWELEDAEIVGFSGDGTTFWATGNYGKTLLKIDTATGSYEELELPSTVPEINPYTGEMEDEQRSVLDGTLMMEGDKAWYLVRSYVTDNVYLFVYDTATGTHTYWTVLTWDDSDSGYGYGRLVAVAGEYALIWNRVDNTLLEFHTGTGESRVLAENVTVLPAFAAASEDAYLLGTANTLRLMRWGGEAALEMDLGEFRAVSCCQWEDTYLALCDDGYMNRFDNTGALLSRTVMVRYNTFAGTVNSEYFEPGCITWERTTDGDLLLGIDNAGNVIDCETWKLRAWIPNYYRYLSGSDRVLMRDTLVNDGLCTFPFYSTEDIKAMAEEALNGAQLTEEQRVDYGLD